MIAICDIFVFDSETLVHVLHFVFGTSTAAKSPLGLFHIGSFLRLIIFISAVAHLICRQKVTVIYTKVRQIVT